MMVIPAIDLKGGCCVRLRQGRMDEETVFDEDPVAVAARWVEAGTRRLHLVDLDGAVAGEPAHEEVIREIANRFPGVDVQVGGGIRSVETALRYADAGVDWVIIGTRAVREPAFVHQVCQEIPGKVIVGLDARGGYVATDGWAETSEIEAQALARRFESAGVSAIVFTDIGRDGMMKGVNVEETQALAAAIRTPVIASGGVRSLDDIRALARAPERIAGVIVGRAIYDGGMSLEEAIAVAREEVL